MVNRPTDTSAFDSKPDDTAPCSTCGADVPLDEWHPTVAIREDEGDDSLTIHQFCSEECREALIDE
ncbi:DUF7576 family protein [Haloarchaeobius sp. DFWS5]|uniref:DUF7576 family protein n=1 Tax=Haloarchaeobius sp. DFWS5 TaxID=3446114 RepID=UPI003EC0BD61